MNNQIKNYLSGTFNGPPNLNFETSEFSIVDARTGVPRGTSGTRNYGGYIFEEYLHQLTTAERAVIFDMMRRQDPGVGQLISVVRDSILSLTPEITIKEKYADSADAVKQKEFIKIVLFENMRRSFDKIVKEICSNNIYGFSLFEGLWKNETSQALGQATVLKDLLWRSPKTVWEWHLNKDEELESVVQRAYGDSQNYTSRMHASNLFLFSIEQEGNNFEGISPLRRCYGPWKIKQSMLSLLALGSERYSIPQPIFKAPSTERNSPFVKQFIKAMTNYRAGRDSFLIIPNQFEIAENNPGLNFDPEKIVTTIDFCNKEMIKEASAQFLDMTKGGSYALGKAVMQFFYNGVDSKAKEIAGVFNDRIIPVILMYNRANEPVMTQLGFSAAGQSISEEYANSINALAQKNFLTADDTLESFIRKNMNLPQQDFDTARAANNGEEDGENEDNGDNKDKKKEKDNKDKEKDGYGAPSYRKASVLMNAAKARIKGAVGQVIESEADRLISLVGDYWSKAKGTERAKLPPIRANQKKIEKILSETFKEIYENAFLNGKKELIALDRKRGSVLVGYSSYAKKVGKIYTAGDAALMANLIGEELENTIGASYLSIGMDTKSYDELYSKLTTPTKEIGKKKAVASSIALNASKTVNYGRNDYYNSIEKQIESYTYLNDDPVTQICAYLNGKTMKASTLITPPTHWGCKSYIVPNLKKWKNNPEVDKIKITKTMRAEGNLL